MMPGFGISRKGERDLQHLTHGLWRAPYHAKGVQGEPVRGFCWPRFLDSETLHISRPTYSAPAGAEAALCYLPMIVLCVRALIPLASLCHVDNSTLLGNGLLARNVALEKNISLIL